MRIAISFMALFLSVAFMQLSSGSIGPLDVLAGLDAGFTKTEVGLLGSAHFAGFFLGCWWAPRLMGSVGHNRAFAAFAAAGIIGALLHPIIVDPLAWALMRIMTGVSIAGGYSIVEGWLQAKLENTSRGRVLGVYRFVDLSASLIAQLMIGFLDPASFVSYNIIAILCCASLLPLMLTKVKPPEVTVAPRLRPLAAIRLSPLGAAGVIVTGITTPSFRMAGPIYGQEVGLRPDQIGLFLAAAVLGGALAQYPAGWLADRIDRRKILIGLSALATGVCFSISTLGTAGINAVFASSFLFGLITFPIYSVSAAHANDFASPDEAMELSSALIFLYGIGAIASPLAGSVLIDNFGPAALFMMIGTAHLFLIAFGLYRMRARAPAGIRTAYAYLPRTSYMLGRLLRRRNNSP